jgi:hypothetical protein
MEFVLLIRRELYHRTFCDIRCEATTSSISAVDNRCPATLITSSTRPVIKYSLPHLITTISREIKPGNLSKYPALNRSLSFHRFNKVPGGKGIAVLSFLVWPSVPFSSTILILYPQTAFLLNLIEIFDSHHYNIGQPDSVCHQWSIAGMGMCLYTIQGSNITSFAS